VTAAVAVAAAAVCVASIPPPSEPIGVDVGGCSVGVAVDDGPGSRPINRKRAERTHKKIITNSAPNRSTLENIGAAFAVPLIDCRAPLREAASTSKLYVS
jgi:hypothetical protein